MRVELISRTQSCVEDVDSAEDLVAYCARVSNPGNQHNNETAPRLLRYLIRSKHWSPFEMANMCVSIETSRAVAAQILRHRSFSFQEFSQRYAAVGGGMVEPVEVRMAGATNRQSSTEVTTVGDGMVQSIVSQCFKQYQWLLDKGVATETARMVLPLCTRTKLYMNGTIRSWIHYLQQRCDEHTQKEHRLIALEIQAILKQEFPTVFEAVFGEN